MDLRLDRFVTLYLVAPVMRLASEKQLSIPILMYHSITEEDDSRRHAYYRTATSQATFAAQLEYLHAEGYTTISLAQAIDYLQAEAQIAAKLVVITFDDGYSDFYRYAFPVLRRYSFSATVFLPTAYIGENSIPFKRKDCLTWAEVRELNKHGILFGSHTVTHPQLRELSIRAINDEIVNSKKTIEEKLGCAVDSFAYPFAFPQTETKFTRMLRDLLRLAGYHNGVCTIVGRADRDSDPFFIERLPVNSCDDTHLFRAKLTGAYDWVSKSQHLIKMARTQVAKGCGRAKSSLICF